MIPASKITPSLKPDDLNIDTIITNDGKYYISDKELRSHLSTRDYFQ